MELILITGFLGAGKTTFIKSILEHLAGKKLYMIINEFGREGIDGAVLSELGAAIDEICNGSIFCTCRQDQFENSLINAVEEQPDMILVEASGLSDPTNIRKILASQRYSAIDYRGGICLVDTARVHKVYDTARVVKKQISISDLILLNKTDKASAEQADRARELVRRANIKARIVSTSFGRISKEDLDDLAPGKATIEEAENLIDLSQHKYLLEISSQMKVSQLESFLSMIAEDTYRIKGILFLEGAYWLVDCVGSFVQVVPYEGKLPNGIGKLVVLSGQGMGARRSIKNARKWYPDMVSAPVN